MNTYDLFYDTGGHSGPYQGLEHAKESAKRLLLGCQTIGAIEIRDRALPALWGRDYQKGNGSLVIEKRDLIASEKDEEIKRLRAELAHVSTHRDWLAEKINSAKLWTWDSDDLIVKKRLAKVKDALEGETWKEAKVRLKAQGFPILD